ncbi:MAG: HAD hydrolase-like protein [Oscillospiraceae bacterium]|nr:HAD hydrolase-like protein [Oscillospiraceae bacterium]
MKTCILFDLDGTLSDPKEGLLNSYQYALSAFGIREERENLTRFIGPPLRESFASAYGFSPGEVEAVVAKFREFFAETGIYQNTVYPGIPEALKALYDSGKTLCVATNKAALYARQTIEFFRMDRYFTYISGDEMDGSLSKGGKREIIRRALEAVGATDLSAAVMIGDRKHDILGAKQAGIGSIGVLYGYGSREELEEAGAEALVNDANALTGLLLGGL